MRHCVQRDTKIYNRADRLFVSFSLSNRTNDTIIQPSQIHCLSSFVTMLSRFLGFDTNTQRPENWDKVAGHCAASFYWPIHNGNTIQKYAANGYRVDRMKDRGRGLGKLLVTDSWMWLRKSWSKKGTRIKAIEENNNSCFGTKTENCDGNVV